MKPVVKEFFDKATWTLTYVVYDSSSKDAVVIDPVWDYDQGASTLGHDSVDSVCKFLETEGLNLHYIFETHAHADHISSSQILKLRYPKTKVAIGAGIVKVQETFKRILNLPTHFKTDGSQFDLLLKDNEKLQAGKLEIKVISTPGHTPACVSLLIGEDALFTGDALFMPDSGTGRCDFPEGCADDLFVSVFEKLYKLPDSVRVFVGHDYGPNGREILFQSTIGEEKRNNIHIKAETKKEEFITFRKNRDKSLQAPRLLLPSIQVNIDGGHLPEKDNSGKRFLKIPISVL